jgi:hypothetical protein
MGSNQRWQGIGCDCRNCDVHLLGIYLNLRSLKRSPLGVAGVSRRFVPCTFVRAIRAIVRDLQCPTPRHKPEASRSIGMARFHLQPGFGVAEFYLAYPIKLLPSVHPSVDVSGRTEQQMAPRNSRNSSLHLEIQARTLSVARPGRTMRNPAARSKSRYLAFSWVSEDCQPKAWRRPTRAVNRDASSWFEPPIMHTRCMLDPVSSSTLCQACSWRACCAFPGPLCSMPQIVHHFHGEYLAQLCTCLASIHCNAVLACAGHVYGDRPPVPSTPNGNINVIVWNSSSGAYLSELQD